MLKARCDACLEDQQTVIFAAQFTPIPLTGARSGGEAMALHLCRACLVALSSEWLPARRPEPERDAT